MRVLCVHELGSATEALSQLKQCVLEIRNQHEHVDVHLALRGVGSSVELDWVDRLYQTPATRVKSAHEAHGFWRLLHNSGWTDERLRKETIRTWASLYHSVQPDYVLCAGSPSAALVAVLEGFKVIQVGSGQYISAPSVWPDVSPFPELEAWLYVITQRTAEQLLNTASLIFSPAGVQEFRPGVAFNVYEDVLKKGIDSVDTDVLAIWDIRHALTAELMSFGTRHWGSRFQCITPDELRVKGFSAQCLADRRPLIIGNYDPLSLSLAVSIKLGYLGAPLTRYQQSIAKRCEESRLAYHLDDNLDMLSAHVEQPMALKAHGSSRAGDQGEFFSPLPALLSWLVR
jgi:hypothetical protein